MNLKTSLITFAFLAATTHASAQAASLDELVAQCNDCHGKNGVSEHADMPTIAGYSEATIETMMFAFADKTRPATVGKFRHGDTSRAETDMTTIALALTEDQILELSTYYSEQTFVPMKQPFDAALAASGEKGHEKRCVKCHEDGGSSADDDAGILAGQGIAYLQQAFKNYRNGTRESEEEMLKKINKLSDKQVESLIHYYASQQ